MTWLDCLEKNPDAMASYREHLEKRRAQEEQAQDAATTWEAAKSASGRKKLLDEMLRELIHLQQEGNSLARYRAGR